MNTIKKLIEDGIAFHKNNKLNDAKIKYLEKADSLVKDCLITNTHLFLAYAAISKDYDANKNSFLLNTLKINEKNRLNQKCMQDISELMDKEIMYP